MANNQTSLAVISSGDNALSTLVRTPTSSAYRLQRYSASQISSKDFPNDFVFGASTAAYQVEGAYLEGGKGLSNWDAFTLKTPDKISDGSNGCVATDQYHRYKEDVMLLKKLGLRAYRLSISWSRVLPGGRLSMGKNTEGIKYYNDVIDFCLAQGIDPFVTLFHFEMPESLEQEFQGFLSKDIIKYYVEFAELCFFEFGDRVKHWFTMNEPEGYAYQGYEVALFPPGLSDNGGTNQLTVGHNLILAHASAVNVYRKTYQAVQGGEIGMAISIMSHEPLNEDDPNDVVATSLANDFTTGWFLEPLTNGQYPATLVKAKGDQLPTFTKEEEKLVKGSFDFVALNYYTGRYVKSQPNPSPDSPPDPDRKYYTLVDERDGIPIGPKAYPGSYINIVPYGIQKVLVYVKTSFGDPLIYITENGMPELEDSKKSVSEALPDDVRVKYLQDHLYYVKKALQEDHVKVAGYFVWSLLDNYEWSGGYTNRFGLYYVDFKNGLNRYPKSSALWMMNFMGKNVSVVKKRSRDEEDDGVAKRVKA